MDLKPSKTQVRSNGKDGDAQRGAEPTDPLNIDEYWLEWDQLLVRNDEIVLIIICNWVSEPLVTSGMNLRLQIDELPSI